MDPIRSEAHSYSGGVSATARRSFGERLLAALALKADLYEEVEHDPGALPQAAAVVALSGVATAVASLASFGAAGLLSGLLAAFFGWLVWTAIVWLVGVKLFDHRSDFGELARTLGFVAAPQLLYLLAAIPFPVWQGLVALLVLGMTVVAFVRATRQALDVDTGRALLVAALGVVAYVLLGLLFAAAARLA